MEQAVGRYWRTGNPADQVYVHHFKIANTTDARKYSKIGERIKINDALSLADLGEDYVARTIDESTQNLLGSFDKDVTDWTPEQRRAALDLAGLRSKDVPPLAEIPALREHFERTTFGKTVAAKQWRETGDQRIEEIAVMNDLKLAAGRITKEKHAKAKKALARMTKRWLELTHNTMAHPVARYVGEDFAWKPESEAAVGDTTETVPGKQRVYRGMPPGPRVPPLPLPLP
jgi:hypothetical protein